MSGNFSNPHLSLINKEHKHPSFWLKIVNHKISQSLISSLARGPSEPTSCTVSHICEIYLYAYFCEIPQSPIFLPASRLCEHSGTWAYVRMWVWISIVTASQLSWTLKCQPWVQALTCPHVVLSTVAATGIKHTFLARFENRNATVVASAAVRCLCTVII